MAALGPVLSKQFCSISQTTFSVRKRPRAVQGGGFVVTNCSGLDLAFRTEACAGLGVKGELVLRDSNGIALFLVRKKAVSFHRQWRAYSLDYEGTEKLIFCVKEPLLCFAKKCSLKVQLAASSFNSWDFEISGSFIDRQCTITDHRGKLVAEIRAQNKAGTLVSKDLYYVIVQPGFDQAFVFGIIAILDNIYEGSTAY
ncbi:LURP-one-related 16 protein [Nymphaea thermarum]|nr:LURP-one-related 16 protein [Nymphaea thermarum]